MLAENISATFIQQISSEQDMPVALGYFRSKLFITDAFTNPIIGAASPIISMLERINLANQLPEVSTLHENIKHEFLAFASHLKMKNCSNEFLAIANYLISATTDELLGKNYLRLSGKTEAFAAFTPITGDGIGPEEHFFNIVQQIITDPEQFLDLIELAYYCLLIGFEGKYHLQANGRDDIGNLIENLFQLIQKNRTNQNHKLFKSYINKKPASLKKKSFNTLIITMLLTMLSLFSLSIIWFNHDSHELFNSQQSLLETLE